MFLAMSPRILVSVARSSCCDRHENGSLWTCIYHESSNSMNNNNNNNINNIIASDLRLYTPARCLRGLGGR